MNAPLLNNLTQINDFRLYSFPQLNVCIHNIVFVSIGLMFFFKDGTYNTDNVTHPKTDCFFFRKYEALNRNNNVPEIIA